MEENQSKRPLFPTWSNTKAQDDDVPETKVGINHNLSDIVEIHFCSLFQPFRNTPMTLSEPKSIHVFGEVGNKHLQTAGDMVEKVTVIFIFETICGNIFTVSAI